MNGFNSKINFLTLQAEEIEYEERKGETVGEMQRSHD